MPLKFLLSFFLLLILPPLAYGGTPPEPSDNIQQDTPSKSLTPMIKIEAQEKNSCLASEITGKFDIYKAKRAFKCIVADWQISKSEFDAANVYDKERSTVPIVETNFDYYPVLSFTENGQDKKILFVSYHLDQECPDVCPSITGAIIFSKISNTWQADKYQKIIARNYFNNKPEIIKIGNDVHGILFTAKNAWEQGQYERLHIYADIDNGYTECIEIEKLLVHVNKLNQKEKIESKFIVFNSLKSDIYGIRVDSVKSISNKSTLLKRTKTSQTYKFNTDFKKYQLTQ